MKTDLLLFSRQTVLCGLPSKFVPGEKKEKISTFAKYMFDVLRYIYQRPESESTHFILLHVGPRVRKQKGERIDRVSPTAFAQGSLHLSSCDHATK